MNLYGYCLDDPVNFVDPTGENVWAIVGLAMLAAGSDLLGQIVANVATGQPWDCIDWWEVGRFAFAGAILGAAAIGLGAGAIGADVIGAILGVSNDAIILNPPINITKKGLGHVVERHTFSGKYPNKSKFNVGEDVVDLILRTTQYPMVRQPNGNYQRVLDLGRNIGIDRNTGKMTSIITVITDSSGDLVTAFPGLP